MKEQRYWFPVRPARNGWGWGLPNVWQGWAAYALYWIFFFVGILLIAPYGVWAIVTFACVWAALFIGMMFWKGEPQSMRDNSSP